MEKGEGYNKRQRFSAMTNEEGATSYWEGERIVRWGVGLGRSRVRARDYGGATQKQSSIAEKPRCIDAPDWSARVGRGPARVALAGLSMSAASSLASSQSLPFA